MFVSLQRISKSTPLVPFFPPRRVDALVATVVLVTVLVVDALDDFVARATVPNPVLAPEKQIEKQRAQPPDGDVGQDDSMAETIPGLVVCPVLYSFQ